MKKYKIAHYGLGHRGNIFLSAFNSFPERFEIIGLCSRDNIKLNAYSRDFLVSKTFTDVNKMLEECNPDIFSFVTPPSLRLPFVQLAEKYKVKALYFEKPIATSIQEAYKIKEICDRNSIKAVVSHQCKYLTSLQKLKEIIKSGQLGKIIHIHATTIPWLEQLGTHFMDYLLWANGGYSARWAVGHIHGKEHLNTDHPSVDYVLGQIELENGIRAFIESGYLSPSYLSKELFWLDDRLTFYGENGYAWADHHNRWALLSQETSGKLVMNQGPSWLEMEIDMQIKYNQDFLSWLDNEDKIHPCNVSSTYHGFEILYGIQLSALKHIRTDFPINSSNFIDINSLFTELPELIPCTEWCEHGNPI